MSLFLLWQPQQWWQSPGLNINTLFILQTFILGNQSKVNLHSPAHSCGRGAEPPCARPALCLHPVMLFRGWNSLKPFTEW